MVEHIGPWGSSQFPMAALRDTADGAAQADSQAPPVHLFLSAESNQLDLGVLNFFSCVSKLRIIES